MQPKVRPCRIASLLGGQAELFYFQRGAGARGHQMLGIGNRLGRRDRNGRRVMGQEKVGELVASGLARICLVARPPGAKRPPLPKALCQKENGPVVCFARAAHALQQCCPSWRTMPREPSSDDARMQCRTRQGRTKRQSPVPGRPRQLQRRTPSHSPRSGLVRRNCPARYRRRC